MSKTIEDALMYARERVAETGRAYIITDMLHVWLDCPSNRRGLTPLGLRIIKRVAP